VNDSFVFPAMYEASELVIIEVMALRPSVIVSKIAGVAELITGGRAGFF